MIRNLNIIHLFNERDKHDHQFCSGEQITQDMTMRTVQSMSKSLKTQTAARLKNHKTKSIMLYIFNLHQWKNKE